MKIKEGVIMPDKIEMRRVLITAEKVWKNLGQELVVTSGKEGCHSAGSLHYYGYAVDLRTRYFTEEERFRAYAQLIHGLEVHSINGQERYRPYTVILHDTHIHVEKDYWYNAPTNKKDANQHVTKTGVQ